MNDPKTPQAAPQKEVEARYLTDDRDRDERFELKITLGGNGDWYVSVIPEGHRFGPTVRLSTSGGASSAVPGLTVAIADAYRALMAANAPGGRNHHG